MDGISTLVLQQFNTLNKPMWFGDAPQISAKCGRQVCHCMQMPVHLAVTEKVGTRYVTAMGTMVLMKSAIFWMSLILLIPDGNSTSVNRQDSCFWSFSAKNKIRDFIGEET